MQKLKRNTETGNKAAAHKAKQKREEVAEQLRQEVFSLLCKCGRCSHGNYSHLCMSLKEIAGTANTLKVPTLRGQVGTWKPSMVKNLFGKLKPRSIFDIC